MCFCRDPYEGIDHCASQVGRLLHERLKLLPAVPAPEPDCGLNFEDDGFSDSDDSGLEDLIGVLRAEYV